ncbi:hypothetical protein CWE13_09475 [Aliidiomarina shirensis]|uniref:Uncharacterized protein n=1 Tax=Aliidiomarina shirensis TaxID=1048642 RepID=A0A432WQP6_9GAMM|nr:hypothetical protein [Aliidiomarina shirensis]RUO36095.1 hypothetical protein CWE13_09475 [Aliidiomarina shirensis]
MINKPILLLLSLIFFWGVANAEEIPGPQARPQGDLDLIIVASESDAYIREWLNTPPEQGVTIKRTRVAKPDQLLVTAFLVTGLTAGDDGRYRYSIDTYILGPDGDPIWGQRNYAGGAGVLPARPMVLMADPALDLILEQSDPEGIYTVVGQVTDLASGSKADSSYEIQFTK